LSTPGECGYPPSWEENDILAAILRLLGGRAISQRDLLSLYIAVFLTEIGVSAAFPLRMLYAQTHHATPIQLGLIASVFFLAPIMVQYPLGWLVDRWGRVPLLLLGTASHAVIGVAYIVFNTPVELIALRFLEGVTVAAIQPAMFAYVADVTSPEHRSEAYGVLGSVMNGGLLIGPLIGGIVGQNAGFAAAYIFSAAFEIVAVLLVLAYLREPVRHASKDGETRGPVSWRQLVSFPLLGAYTAFFSFQVVMGMFSGLWTIWMRDLGASYTYIGITFTVFALPQIFLGALAGRAGDRWGRGPVLLYAGLLISVVYASYGFATSLALLLVLGIVEGLFLVFQQPAVQGLLADASPVDARGRAQGVAGVAGAIGGASAAFISLPLYHYNRPLPFVLAGIVMAIGSVLSAFSAIILLRRTKRARTDVPAA
jgi:DHA1 family multidrug resistance protein-like MFS transporter